MQNHQCPETLRQCHDVAIAQICPQLGKIGSLEGAGMQINQRISVAHDLIEKGKCNSGRGAAGPIARKIPVQVAPIRQVPRRTPESLQIDDWHTDNGSG